jgi:hypothetical protein
MMLMHRLDWHYAPEIGPIAPDMSYQLWCKWCGLRMSFYKAEDIVKGVQTGLDYAKFENKKKIVLTGMAKFGNLLKLGRLAHL